MKKSHQLRPHPAVVINQSFYSPTPAPTPSPMEGPMAGLQSFVQKPSTQKALAKIREAMRHNNGRSQATDAQWLTSILLMGLAHAETTEEQFRRDWRYCDAEGLELGAYWEQLMLAKLKPRRP